MTDVSHDCPRQKCGLYDVYFGALRKTKGSPEQGDTVAVLDISNIQRIFVQGEDACATRTNSMIC